MGMHRILKIKISEAINKLGLTDIEPEVEIPKNENFGDLSSPVAMELAKKLKKSPRQIAEEIVSCMDKTLFENVEIAGAGFINFKFKKDFIFSQFENLLREGEKFLIHNIGNGEKVQIEFVSANPTGPLHLGHGRGAALGAALSNILREAGYDVSTEYYINDAGKQIELLGLSVYIALQSLFGKDIAMPEECYKGEYIYEIAKEIYESYGEELKDKSFDEVGALLIDFSYKKYSMKLRKTLRTLELFLTAGLVKENFITQEKFKEQFLN